MTLTEAIKVRLKEIMEQKGFTAYKLHKEGGIPKSTISQVLNGVRKGIEVKTLYELLDTMHVGLGEFFSNPLFEQVTD